MSTLAKLMVVLGIDAGGYSDGLNRAARDAEQASGRMSTVLSAGVAVVGSSIGTLTSLAVAGATTYTKYQQQLTEVFTLLPGITESAMSAMSDDVQAFALEFGVLPEKEIPALYNALSSGVPADNVFSFLETAQKAAVAGVTDLSVTVDGLTSVVNAYGSETISAAEASDQMFAAVVFGKTTFEELSSTLYNVNPIAASLGVAFGDVTSSIAAMTAQGIPTAQTTTMLRQLFVELGDSTSNVGKIFQGVAGQSFKAFIASGGNVQDALKLLETNAQSSNKGVNELFSSVEAGSAALALTGKGTDLFTNALLATADSAGATERAYGTMNDTIAQSVNKIKAAGAVFLTIIGEKMGPTIERLLGGLVQLATSDSAIKFVGALGTAIDKAINLIMAFGTAVVGIARAALGWGNAIGTNFAQGIIDAAYAVVAALQDMGSIISYWLQPGSPPRIVPDLDTWGQEAASVYMSKWSKADMSDLDTLGGIIEQSLHSMVSSGALQQSDLIPRLLGSKAAIAQGIDEIKRLGDVSSKTFESIIRALGPTGTQMRTTLQAYFDLRRASDALDRSQNNLNDTTRQYDAILAPLNAQMADLENKERAIRDTKRLTELQDSLLSGILDQSDALLAQNEIEQIKLRQQIASTEATRKAAITAAQTQVDAAQATVNSAQDAYQTQQALVTQQNKQNELLAQQIDLVKRLAGTTDKKELSPLEQQQEALAIEQQRIGDLARLRDLQTKIASKQLGAYDTALATNEVEQIKLRLQAQGIDYRKDELAAAQATYEVAKKRAEALAKELTPLEKQKQALEAQQAQIQDLGRLHDLQTKIATGQLGAYDTAIALNEIEQIKLRLGSQGVDIGADQYALAQDAYDLAKAQLKITDKAVKQEKELTELEKQQQALDDKQQQIRDLGRLHDLQKALASGELGAYETAIAQNEIEQIKLRLSAQGVDFSKDDFAAAQDAFELEQKRVKELEKLQKLRGGGSGSGGGIGTGGGMPALGDVKGPLDAINTTIDTVKGKIQSAKESVASLVDGVVNGAQTTANALYTTFEPAITSTMALFNSFVALVLGIWAIIQTTIATYGTQIWASAQNTFGNLVTMVVTAFTTVAGVVTTIFGALVAFLTDNQTKIANIIGPIILFVIDGIGKIAEFITDHIKPVLAGIGAALLYLVFTIAIPAFIAWAVQAWAVAAANIAAFAPIIAIMLLIGVTVALLYYAWETNFLGMRDVLTDVWNNYLLPAFTAVQEWLTTNIPIAVEATALFWNTILKPALLDVWEFIVKNVIPIFTTAVNWLKITIPQAVQTTANFWNNILKPAIMGVWSFITTRLIPLFTALVNVHLAVLNVTVKLLAAAWQNVLKPALVAVQQFVSTYIIPIFTWLYQKVFNEGLKPALQSVAFFILGTLIPQFMAIKATVSAHLGPALGTAQKALGGVKDAFGYIDSAISSTIKWIQKVADKLNSISVPSWLQGHSPPPMAHWFDYIGEAARIAAVDTEKFNAALDTNPAMGGMNNSIIGAARSDTATSQRGGDMNITINRAPDDPRTSRDEIRAQGMLWGLSPVG